MHIWFQGVKISLFIISFVCSIFVLLCICVYLQIIRHIQHNNYPSLFIIIRSWCERKKKATTEISLFQLRRSMEPVINVILMPSWKESNRSDRHGQLAIAIHNLGGLYFRVIIFFHSRIEKMNRVAMKWTLSAYPWNQHIVWAWWRARAYRQTHTHT